MDARGGWACACGAVAFAFPTRTPITSILDCCAACYRFARWAAGAARREPPSAPFKNYYMPNDIAVVRGRDHLRAYTAAPTSGTICLLADCCKTRAGFAMPDWQGRFVAVHADDGCPDLDTIQPEALFWADSLKGVVPDDELPVWDGPEERCIRGDETPEEYARKAQPLLAKIAAQTAAPRQWESFQSIVSSLGEVTPLDLR